MGNSGGKSPSGHLSRRTVLRYGAYAGMSALSAPLWLTGCDKKGASRKPNILLVTVDTLRPDHLGCYGYSKTTSPHIDRFAQDSVLFERCFSHAPETRMSVASILSGFLPHETKVPENNSLSPKVQIIPEILRRYGYKTAAVVSNYVLRKGEGFEQGFSLYDDTMKQHELVRGLAERIAEYTTNRAIELLEQHTKGSLFLWIHYQDPHGPYTPPGKFAELFVSPQDGHRILKFNDSLSGRGGIPLHQRLGDNRNYYYYVSQYDGEIAYMDEHFSRLLDALKRLGFYDDSLIIFTSDHGEGMGEHDYYFAHIDYLYNGLTHVPLILKYGKNAGGRRQDFVRHIDIVPTILNAAGIDSNPHYRGMDLFRKDGPTKEIFAAMNSPQVRDGKKFSLVYDNAKLIYTPIDESYELFDLKTDFDEQQNVINNSAYKERSKDLKARLARILKEDFLNVPVETKSREQSEQEKENLRALGYVR
jgi:arylsulfatase A-like enzyme